MVAIQFARCRSQFMVLSARFVMEVRGMVGMVGKGGEMGIVCILLMFIYRRQLLYIPSGTIGTPRWWQC